MLATSSSLNLTPLTYLAGRLWLFPLILALFSCRSSEVIVYFSSSSVHLPRSFAVLIHVLLIWWLLSKKLLSLVLNKFEEFVDVIFPSFSWSPSRYVGPVFWAEFGVPFCSFHQPSLTRWCCYSQRQSPFHVLWVLFQHRIFAFSIFSMASFVLHFLYSVQSSSSISIQSNLPSISVVSISSSVSFSKDTSLSWSLWVFELCPSSLSSPVLLMSLVSFFFVGLVLFHDLFVSSFRLYDESEHFALRRLYHSFVLFCGCPCSWCAADRRSYHCVDVWASSFSMSVPVCTCETSPRKPWFDFWFRSSPVAGK